MLFTTFLIHEAHFVILCEMTHLTYIIHNLTLEIYLLVENRFQVHRNRIDTLKVI